MIWVSLLLPIMARLRFPDEIEANGWMIWPPIRYSYQTANSNIPHSAPTRPFWLMRQGRTLLRLPAGRKRPRLYAWQSQLAGHRRSGARRRGADDLRLPHFRAVRPLPDHRVRHCRRHRRRRAGLFWRLDGSSPAALYRNLVIDAGALHPLDHRRHPAARFLHSARHHAPVLLGRLCRHRPGRVLAGAQFRVCAGRPGAWRE